MRMMTKKMTSQSPCLSRQSHSTFSSDPQITSNVNKLFHSHTALFHRLQFPLTRTSKVYRSNLLRSFCISPPIQNISSSTAPPAIV